MKITIKQFQGVLLSHVLVLGLTACSSTPSPWSESDESPWRAKRDAEAATTSVDEFVAVPVEEPAMVEPEPLPVMEEPVAMPEPEPIPEPETVVESPAMGIMSMPASGYAVQVYAGKTEKSVIRYQGTYALQDLMMVKTEREGEIYYVLVSAHEDRASANQAAADLEQKTGSRPWVRPLSGLQRIAVN